MVRWRARLAGNPLGLHCRELAARPATHVLDRLPISGLEPPIEGQRVHAEQLPDSRNRSAQRRDARREHGPEPFEHIDIVSVVVVVLTRHDEVRKPMRQTPRDVDRVPGLHRVDDQLHTRKHWICHELPPTVRTINEKAAVPPRLDHVAWPQQPSDELSQPRKQVYAYW